MTPMIRLAVRLSCLLASGLCAANSRGTPWNCRVIDDSSRGADGVRLADANGDGLMDIVTGWEEGGITRVYLNPGHAKAKEKWPAVTVAKTPSVEDAVFADLDGDGALDAVSCCEGRQQAVLVSWAPKEPERYLTPESWTTEVIPASERKMKWMFAVPAQVDGKHGVDLVAAGKGKAAQIGWFESPADPRALADFVWHPICPAGWIMSLRLSDMDGDGDLDVVTSDRKGKLRGCRWLENPGPGAAQREQWENHGIGGAGEQVMFMTIADLDQDGLEDVLVAVKPAKVLLLRRLDATGTSWKGHTIAFPDNTGTAKAVEVGDIDRDDRQDLVFSCEHAAQGKSGVMWLSYRNEPTDSVWDAHEISGAPGIKYDRLELIDLDGDGDLDVLTCEEREGKRGLGVFWYENPGE